MYHECSMNVFHIFDIGIHSSRPLYHIIGRIYGGILWLRVDFGDHIFNGTGTAVDVVDGAKFNA